MNNDFIITLIGAAAATYLTRFPLMLFSSKVGLPRWLVEYMKYIAPSVLAALIFPIIFIKDGALDLSLSNDFLLAGIASSAAAYFSKNMLVSIICGIGVLALLVYVI